MAGSDSAPARLDAALVRRGLEASRERAKQRILAGDVLVNGRVRNRPSFPVRDTDELMCKGEGLAYVGRGGCKLEKAVAGRFDLNGVTALDVGASTGGFTDCLLRSGAARVYAVDVGHGQLHPSLAADPRVVNLEGTDIRDRQALLRAVPAASVSFCAVDVSFISLTAVLPSVLPFLKKGAGLVCLVKPQFEAGRTAGCWPGCAAFSTIAGCRCGRWIIRRSPAGTEILNFWRSCGMMTGTTGRTMPPRRRGRRRLLRPSTRWWRPLIGR